MAPPVPAVEVAHHAHPARAGRPHGEARPLGALDLVGVRAQHLPQAQVRALADQVQVEVGDGGRRTSRRRPPRLVPPASVHAQAVAEGVRAAGQHPLEEAVAGARTPSRRRRRSARRPPRPRRAPGRKARTTRRSSPAMDTRCIPSTRKTSRCSPRTTCWMSVWRVAEAITIRIGRGPGHGAALRWHLPGRSKAPVEPFVRLRSPCRGGGRRRLRVVGARRNGRDSGVFGAETPNRAARCVGHDTAVPNAAGPPPARRASPRPDGPARTRRRRPGPPGAHPSRIPAFAILRTLAATSNRMNAEPRRDAEDAETRAGALRFLRALRCSAFTQLARPAPPVRSRTPHDDDVLLICAGYTGTRPTRCPRKKIRPPR